MDHQLSLSENGQYRCALCQRRWRTKPRSPCVGVPCYEYGCWPDTLYTATQLRRLKLKPPEKPDGYYPLVKAPYRRLLYDINRATPRRVPTERQREAIAKMRLALVETYTCRGCGYSDASHGRSRSGVRGGYCPACWRELRHRRRQARVCAWAKAYLQAGDFVVLDSETTGLGGRDEVIELALVHSSGTVLFSSLIQPQDPQRPDLATHIHGITNAMLADAPRFVDVWPLIAAILRRFRRVLVYNAAFDRRMLAATATRYGLRVPGGAWECLMEQYAVYYGDWSSYHQSYTWQSLDMACADLAVSVVGEAHRASADALSALGVLKALAARADALTVATATATATAARQAPTPAPEAAGKLDADDLPF
jgi:DNA polymerase-3 subunit epsilon